VNTETPRVVVLNFARNKPDQVTAAFLRACHDSEEKLGGRDLFKSAQSLIVFGDFEIKKVHITGNQGWIDVQIDELVSLAGGKVEVRERSERQRWSLRRDDTKSWMLTPSRNDLHNSPRTFPTTLPAIPVELRRRPSWRECLMCFSENSQPYRAQEARMPR
jgi:hypothetical protein